MFDQFPKVALLGRPNVGKSTLFNRLIRSNRAITHDRPGVTRDRMEGIVNVQGERRFAIIDTGGVTLDRDARVSKGPQESEGFEEYILQQAKGAIHDSAILCLVVDGREGLTPFDKHLADFIRKANKPTILIVNKVDGPDKADLLMAEFHELGFFMMPCSASHGFNVRALQKHIVSMLTDEQQKASPQLTELPDSMQGATKRQKKRMLQDLQAGNDESADEEEAFAENVSFPAESEAPLDGLSPDEAFAAVDSSDADENYDELAEEELEFDIDLAQGDVAGSDLPVGSDASVCLGEPEASDSSEDVAEEPSMFQGDGDLRIALLGRPNAGKSSLVNAMVGENRMIVSDIAGTTRDSVDVETVIDGEPCVFVDTAGVRRRSRITDTVERYSVNSSIKSTTKAHVTLLLLDVSEGITSQDKRLIDLLNERKTPFMVLVNKSDMIPAGKRKEIEQDFAEILSFCRHVPVLFISALKKRNLKRIVPLAKSIREECHIRISTGQLNRAMTAVLERHQPPVVKRARAKFFYLTQAESAPPTFVFFVNSAERVLPSYARYLERSLRKLFGVIHAPMRVHFRSSHGNKKKR